LGEENIEVKLLKCFLVFQGVFLDVVFSLNLKSKEVLLSGIGRGSFRVISWAGLGGWGKKGGIPFIYLFIYLSFSHNMVT
jgi:hypothetical protein